MKDLFDVRYGLNLELNKFEIVSRNEKDCVNFVSRSAYNNGITAIVKRVKGIEPQPAGTITVAGGGSSVLSAFVQEMPFYSGRDLYVLYPKVEMNKYELLFYSYCINLNKYRYSFGRQANKTLKDIEIVKNVPEWVYELNLKPKYLSLPEKQHIDLNEKNWKEFRIGNLFRLINGIKYPKEYRKKGDLPLISTTSTDNGVSDLIEKRSPSYKNILTVAYSGSVGEIFYHEKEVFVGETVFAMIPLFQLNKYNGLFICTIIRNHNKRYNYGRKIIGSKYLDDVIKLPVTEDGKPDFSFMEMYVKQLHYSEYI